MKVQYFLILTWIIPFGCSELPPSQTASTGQPGNNEQLNISILIDLSDRILENADRDQELVQFLAAYFREHFENKNLHFIHDQMKVFFYPEPKSEQINRIAESLKIKLDPSRKEGIKAAWETMVDDYSRQLSLLYQLAQEDGEQHGFPGSDIHGFIKEKVHHYCIDPDPMFRNILIVFTDGYLYHKNSQYSLQNRTSYLTGPYLDRSGLRGNVNWKDRFEKQDFGFITNREDLEQLEVLVLEVDPSEKYPGDGEIIKSYWSKWLTEMGISRFSIHSSDLPSNTKELINIFLSD